MTQIEGEASRAGPSVKTGWICLVIGWLAYLLPIPLFGLGLLIGGGLSFAAFVIAIISMNKSEGGLALLLASLIGTSLVYLAGLAFTAWNIIS